MRQAVANALWHAAHRTAFQRKLIDQPLMRRVLADLAIESEAATALTFRIAKSFDESADEGAAAFARIATPIGKYWINKRVVNLAYEAMEVHGGGGYVEDGVMTRIYRQSPLNSIWEGSGNVVCLDILRAIRRDPRSAQELVAELVKSRGANRLLDRAIDGVKSMLAGQHEEALARRLAETMALALQGAILIQNAPGFVSDAFCATRLCDHPGLSCGASDAKIDVDAVLSRAMPH
jgi:putative acyl-CoA dehydrogenase